jgi:hypothetical protein
MRPAQSFGKSKASGKSCAREPPLKIGKKRAFAAEEMGHAANVEPKTAGAVGVQVRAVAARRPASEIAKGLFVFLRGGGQREKVRTDGAGIGKAEPGGEAVSFARFVERGDEKSPLFVADQH